MTPKIFSFLFFLIGLSFFVYSTRLNCYKDDKAKEALDREASDHLLDKQWKQRYFSEVDNLKTNKLFFEDIGSGLAIASMTVLLFLFRKRINSFRDFKSVQSLSRKQIFIFSNLVWLLIFPSIWWYYSYRGDRGDFPWFSDTVIIPIIDLSIFCLIAFIPLNLFIWLTSIKSNLPTKLFVKSDYRTGGNISKNVFWYFCLLLNILALLMLIEDGDHLAIPVNLFFTFVLLSLRAGQLNRTNASTS